MAAWSETRVSGTAVATKQVTPAPKPPKRHKAAQGEWDTIRAAFAHAACAHCGLRAESLHHIVSKARGGDDVEANLVPLCGDGTRGCHGLLESHGTGWERVAASVRNYVCSRSDRWAYVLGKLGETLFDRTYPAKTRVCSDRFCVLPDGHSGPHLPLSDKAFESREERFSFPREPLEEV